MSLTLTDGNPDPTADGKTTPTDNPYSRWYFNLGAKYQLSRRYEADDPLYAVLIEFDQPVEVEPMIAGKQSLLLQSFGTAQFTNSKFLQASLRQSDVGTFVQSLKNPKRSKAKKNAEISVKEITILPMPLPPDSYEFPENASVNLNEAPEHTVPESIESVTVVIDDSINFTHPRFRTDDESRFDYVWVMDAKWTDSTTVPHGREWVKSEIDTLIKDHGDDHRRCLQEIGAADFTRQTYHAGARDITHGTAVADLAGGDDPSDKDAPTHRLIGVNLPTIATEDPSGMSLVAPISAAIDYGLSRARLLTKGKKSIPVVVNLSYALSAGPHDGKGLFERIMDAMIDKYKLSTKDYPFLVIPSGNDFQARGHAVFGETGGKKTEFDLTWALPFGDRSNSFLEIWLDTGNTLEKLELTSPLGDKLDLIAIAKKPVPHIISVNGHEIGQVTYDELTNGRPRILFCMIPSRVEAGFPCPGGDWIISGKASGGAVNAWIQRDAAPYGYRQRGATSFLRDAEYKTYHTGGANGDELNGAGTREDQAASKVKRAGSVSALSTSASAITVGAYFHRKKRCLKPKTPLITHRTTDYSGEGAAGMNITLYEMPGDTSRALRGVAVASTRGHSGALSGTSVAAPLMTREIARGQGVQHPRLPGHKYEFKGQKQLVEDRKRFLDRKQPRRP